MPTTSPAATAAAMPEGSEARLVLLEMAHGRTGAIPAALLVDHVLQLEPGADWPVNRAAFEAVLRRLEFMRRDRLRVCSRPDGGRALGSYRTRRPRQQARPYKTLLVSLEPLHLRCNCPDFLRSSLGVCKHGLAVLESLASRPRTFARALAEAPRLSRSPHLIWDPVRPLEGRGDWMERVRLLPGTGRSSRGEGPRGIARWRDVEGDDSSAGKQLANVHADNPRKRLEIVGKLRAATTVKYADPALRELLRVEHAQLKRTVADRGRARELERSLRGLKRPLYPYQLTGVRRFFEAGQLLLADDMGLGKTVQAVAVCHALWESGTVKRGLLIVPAHLKSQWQREWHAVTDAPLHIVDGAPAERAAIYRRWRKGFLVANYEQVLRDLDLMRAWNPELVVLDEAQRIKNWATKTATFVKQLRPPYRLVLTGTPMENRLDELASIMDWVDDQALEPKWRLTPWHSRFVDGMQGVDGARHLDTLRSRLSHCMLRRRRAEVLDQLPPRTDTVMPLELTDAQREEHEALAQPIARLAHLARRRPLTQDEFLRLMSLLTTQRIVSNGLAQLEFTELWPGLSSVHDPDEPLLKSLSSPKLLELRQLVARVAVEQKRKIVVFSQWRRMLTLAHWATGGLLARHGLRAAFFTGQESQKRRTQNIVDFHDDDEMAILFATDAGGVGLNLQRAASCCINLELPWNPAVLEQRIARIHRLGQRRPIDVYNLVSQDCIESRIARIVADKRVLFEGLFDGDSDEIVFDHSGSFLSRLEKLFEPEETTDSDVDGEEAEDESGIVEDGAAEREVEALLDAADETQDEPSGVGRRAATERASAGEGGRRTLDVPAEVGRWFSQLEVRRTAQGGLKIEASPEAAEGLAAMFEGLAGVLRKSASGGARRAASTCLSL